MSHSAESQASHGRALLAALYSALRLTRESSAGSSALKRTLDLLSPACEPLLDYAGVLRLRVLRQSLYLNDERLESDIENFVFYGHVHGTLRDAGVGVVTLEGLPSRSDWQTFLALVVRVSGPQDDPTKTVKLRRAMASRGVRHIDVEPPLVAART